MLFTTLALAMAAVGQGPADWYEPFPAHKVIGNVYYVGSKDLATFLISTPEGHILINSGFRRTVPLIQKSVKSLGFKMTDVKILLASHAHSDHVAGHALLRKATGAKVYVMRGDDRVIASGGKGQYLYKTSRWDPCKVDRVLDDRDEVKLGGVTLVARWTPGHTRGCTTWTWRVKDGGKNYAVVVIGSPNVNPGFQLVNNKDYPEMAADFARTFKVLKSLPCDVFLGAHGGYYGMVERHALLKKGKANAFVNPAGYKEYVAQRERAFRKTLATQQGKAEQGKAEQGTPAADAQPKDLVLFDFEKAVDLKAWANLELSGAKVKEPAAGIERSTAKASSGKHSMKITFRGGTWPTLTTTRVPADWKAWHTLKADVRVSRPCVVGFTVLQERSRRGKGYEEAVSRWTRTAFLKAGKNQIEAALRPAYGNVVDPKRGKVVRFEIIMYKPRAGEAIYIDNIRLSKSKEKQPPEKMSFTVAGTDWVLDGVNTSGVLSAGAVIELGKKLKAGWTKSKERSVTQLEEEFAALYGELKKKHPRALLAKLRDGEKGYDPQKPDKVYAGWKDAYFSSHGPDGMYRARAENRGRDTSQEIFMRHRSPLMRVDLVSIPKGSAILAARLIVVRATDTYSIDPRKNPTMWVVEPCNRPWEEHEVNAFQYAKDKFWKQVGGFHWGDDPDFLPVFLAHGPGRGKVNWWDFTLAVRFWTNGGHPNHGFMLHGDARDYMMAHTRETRNILNRPAVLVIYEPK